MRAARLLVDAGSVHTFLAVEVLESICCSPAASTDHIRIVTGSGFLIAARVKVDGFKCLGRKILDMPIVHPADGQLDQRIAEDGLPQIPRVPAAAG